MSFRLLEIIKDPDKRAILSWLGGGAVVAAGGIWTAVTFVVEHKDASDKKGGTNITVSGQGIVSGRDTNIIGPSKEQIEQIQEPLTGQLPSGDGTSPRSTGLSRFRETVMPVANADAEPQALALGDACFATIRGGGSRGAIH